MRESEEYLEKALKLQNEDKIRKFFNPGGEKRQPKTPLEKAEAAGNSTFPIFIPEQLQWALIGPGAALLNSALISESLNMQQNDQLTPVEKVFNYYFEKHMHDLDGKLKKWNTMRMQRNEPNPNLDFELEWDSLYGKYLDGDKITFAVRVLNKPGFDYSKSRFITIQNTTSETVI